MKELLRKKSIRVALYLLGILLALSLLGNWLIRYHTKDLIENIIASQSQGKVKLHIGRFRFSLFPHPQINLHNSRLEIMDQPGTLPGYSAHFNYIGLQLQGLKSFLFDRQLLVDYFVAQDPEITINPHVKKKTRKGNALLHTELGNIYVAVQQLAETMQVKKFGIFNGGLHINRSGPDGFPIHLKDVDFQVDEFIMGKEEGKDSSSGLHVQKLRLHMGPQDITFPKGDYRMKYRGLEINSSDNSVRIDSFYIAGSAKDTSYGALEAGFSNLRLVNIDFRTLYEKDLLKVDSIYCQDPKVRLHIDVSASRERRARKDSVVRQRSRPTRSMEDITVRKTPRNEQVSVEMRIAELLGRLDIGYLGLLNSDISVTTKTGNKYTPFSSMGNNFEVEGIQVNEDSARPVRIENLVFAIKNYKASTSDSLYDFLFDSVVYQRDNLALKNFRLQPSEKNTKADRKYVTIPDFELRNLSIQELATNRKLVAEMLVLKNSRTINYYIPGEGKNKRGNPVRAIVREISKKVSLDKIRIENGYILNRPVHQPKEKIEITGLNSEISANEMLQAPSYEMAGYAIGNLSFDSAQIRNAKSVIHLSKGRMQGSNQTLQAESFRMQDLHHGTEVQAQQIRVKNYHFDDDLQHVRIDSVSWKKARIKYVQSAQKDGSKKGIHFDQFSAGYISLPATELHILQADGRAIRVTLDTMFAQEISKQEGQQLSIQKFWVSGSKLELSTAQLEARASRFRIVERRASWIEGLDIALVQSGDSLQARIPALYFVPDISKTLQQEFPVLSSLEIVRPEIRLQSHGSRDSSTETRTKKPFRMQLDRLSVRDARILVQQSRAQKNLLLESTDLSLNLRGLQMGLKGKKLSLQSADLSTPSLLLNLNDSIQVSTYPGTFTLELADVSMDESGTPEGTQALLKRVSLDNFNVFVQSRKGKKPLALTHVSAGMQDLRIDSAEKNHVIRRIKENPSLFVDNIDFGNQDETKEIRAYGIGYNNGRQELNVDSFVMRPLMDRDSFMRMQTYQKDYMQVHTGKIIVRGMDLQKLLSDSTFQVRSIWVDQPSLQVYKDKRLPYQWGIIKPLPTNLVLQIPLKVNIDSIRLRDGRIRYEEMNDKTGKLATVPLTQVQGLITRARNTDITDTDSLQMAASALLLDTVRFRVSFKESYADSLNGFYYSVRVRPFDMTALNPILEPLAGAQISSGYLDTLAMRSIGREYIAHGKMKLYYRNLKINILNKKDNSKKSIGTRFMNFVANLLIDKKNVQKTGSVYTERIREKGFIGYWVRILLSGALTNTGIRSNKKSEKKYLRSVRKHSVPELPDVDL